MTMLKFWQLEHYETAWRLRSRTRRKGHTTSTAERGLIDFVTARARWEGLNLPRRHELAHDTRWRRYASDAYAADEM